MRRRQVVAVRFLGTVTLVDVRGRREADALRRAVKAVNPRMTVRLEDAASYSSVMSTAYRHLGRIEPWEVAALAKNIDVLDAVAELGSAPPDAQEG